MAEVGLPRLVVALIGVLALVSPARAQTPPAQAQGKIIALNGKVEHAAAARQDLWTNAQTFQSLFTSDRVRTLPASRAAILFIDETQVKMNANAVLTVQTVKQPSGAPTVFDLARGEAWFRTKNPRAGVTIKTPAASAAIRGTEINLRVADDDVTTLTVVEGSVEFSNPQGTILVAAGEEATARVGQAPTKRVILNPENAVQWALYYVNTIAPGDLPGATAADAERTAANQAQLAAAALDIGDVDTARRQLEAALAADPRSIPALTLLSSLELTQNHVEIATALAARALAARPDSIGALIAAAEAAQADFKLDEARSHLDAALLIDPDQLRALLDRARIRFGTSDTDGAAVDAARAAGIRPDDADVRSLLGFIKLANEDETGAREDFEAAIQHDQELGEPHLGLGLIEFRRGLENEGLLEMLTATLLEPHVSLYQSYLGKAYYEAKRFQEGLSALATAKRLDPRDPTPWLYSSFFQRDQYQQVAALGELQDAIARNDNRAVYRSRLLLDRDLATKNVSLAEVYRQLGFSEWALSEARKSADIDSSNASAHLFLADAYLGMGDRSGAGGDELMQYVLNAPVNRNSFNNFNEYTGLFDGPRMNNQLELTGGSASYGQAWLSSQGGNRRAAYRASAWFEQFNEARADKDKLGGGSLTAKVAIGPATDAFVFAERRQTTTSQQNIQITGVQTSGSDLVFVERFGLAGDSNITRSLSWTRGTAGVKHEWRPGSTLVAAAKYEEFDSVIDDVEAVTASCAGYSLDDFGFTSKTRDSFRARSRTFQIRQTSRFGRHQISVGSLLFYWSAVRNCHEMVIGLGDYEVNETGWNTMLSAYVQHEYQATPRLHLTAGVRFQDAMYDTPFGSRQFRYTLGRTDPVLGLSLRLSKSTTLRAAAFRFLNAPDTTERLSPTTVAGFPLERNEMTSTHRRELDVSVEHAWRGVFVSNAVFARKPRLPTEAIYLGEDLRDLFERWFPDNTALTTGWRSSANWVVSSRFGVNATGVLRRSHNPTFRKNDAEIAAGINLVHERGLQARLQVTHARQKTNVLELPSTQYTLVDASLNYEFFRKRFAVTAQVTNALNRHITPIVESFFKPQIFPKRVVRVTAAWRF